MGRREDGMTVIELLIAIMILGIIMAPLATAFVIGLQTTRGSELDAGDSADAQLIAGFWDIDIASAETVSTTGATCGTGAAVVQLLLRDAGVVRYVAYRGLPDAARKAELQLPTDVYTLERVVCSDTSGTVVERQVLARTLRAVPTVTCDSGTCTSTPRRVRLQAVSYATQTPDVGSPGSYTVSVTATRKVTP